MHGVHEKFDGVKEFHPSSLRGIASLQKALYIKQRALYLFVILAQKSNQGKTDFKSLINHYKTSNRLLNSLHRLRFF